MSYVIRKEGRDYERIADPMLNPWSAYHEPPPLKLTPDSRALKSLGLGPDYSGAINAQGANFSAPTKPSSSADSAQTAGFAAGSGVNQ